MTAFWPWWAGAVMLGAIATSHLWIHGHPLGISGLLVKALSLKEERAARREKAILANRAALLAATLVEFGPAAVAHASKEAGAPAAPPSPVPRAVFPRISWGISVLFLASLVLGGLLSALTRGRMALNLSLGPAFERALATGWKGWAVLFLGGTLTGFGVSLMGGCTSGHGLDGCSRLQTGSLVATACFFGTAILIAFLLGFGHP